MSRRPVDPARQCLRPSEWPPLDRSLWEAALAPARSFDARPPDLSPASLEKYAEGYGRWLGFLAWRGELDPGEHPAARLTMERASAYLAHLQATKNRDFTIVGRFAELRRAMELIARDCKWEWLTCPHGRPLRGHFAMRKRAFDVPLTRVLFAWGVEMMSTAITLSGADRRCVMLRDGLMISIFAARGIRHRSMASLELDRNLLRDGDGWRIELAEQDVKTRRSIGFGLPSSLTPWIERYLGRERTELLQGRRTAALWINWSGEPLGYRGIDKRIRWWSAKRFGTAFGPHRFRHALGTSATIEDPGAPGLGAALLGISAPVYQEHYNRAEDVIAAARFQNGVQRERDRTRVRQRPEAPGDDRP
jgi:site-specific recombinase XerD